MNFAQYQTEDRRLVILRLLKDATEYTANEFLLQQILPDIGHGVSQDVLRNDLQWLHEQQLVNTEQVQDMYITKLFTRGLDVAEGRATCIGVKKPMPGSS